MGLDKNIVVFDDSEQNGTQKRLFALIKTIARRNNIILTHFLLPQDIKFDIPIFTFDFSIATLDKIYGIDIIHTKDLNHNGGGLQFFYGQKGTLPKDYKELIVAVGTNRYTACIDVLLAATTKILPDNAQNSTEF